MYEGKRILGLVPARGGSKGIPRKNIKDMAGKPMIARTIEVGLASRYLDDVVVTTDDEEIAQIARSYGASVPFMRPAELAADTSPTIDCVLHAQRELEALGQAADCVVLLQPTSPLRVVSDIDDAVELFYAKGRKGVVSISPVSVNPVLMKTMEPDGELTSLVPLDGPIRRQEMRQYYRVDGNVYVNAWEELRPNFPFSENPYGIVSSAGGAIDVDTMEDFERAVAVIRAARGE